VAQTTKFSSRTISVHVASSQLFSPCFQLTIEEKCSQVFLLEQWRKYLSCFNLFSAGQQNSGHFLLIFLVSQCLQASSSRLSSLIFSCRCTRVPRFTGTPKVLPQNISFYSLRIYGFSLFCPPFHCGHQGFLRFLMTSRDAPSLRSPDRPLDQSLNG